MYSGGTARVTRTPMFAYPPGTMAAIDGIELNSIAFRHARTAAFVASWPCWSAPNPVSVNNTLLIPGRTVGETFLTPFPASPPPVASLIILVPLAAPSCGASCRLGGRAGGWVVDERRRESCTLGRHESAPVHTGDEGSQAKAVEVDTRRRARSRTRWSMKRTCSASRARMSFQRQRRVI
ncbi:hypothetical protein T484DRAFT_1947881 [Baffinella frigidus]|nr:hypothetical protein T484DRAFT_1947881 [Cryptophyta sp. CCMP2293]